LLIVDCLKNPCLPRDDTSEITGRTCPPKCVKHFWRGAVFQKGVLRDLFRLGVKINMISTKTENTVGHNQKPQVDLVSRRVFLRKTVELGAVGFGGLFLAGDGVRRMFSTKVKLPSPDHPKYETCKRVTESGDPRPCGDNMTAGQAAKGLLGGLEAEVGVITTVGAIIGLGVKAAAHRRIAKDRELEA